jgi:hypothetical protein
MAPRDALSSALGATPPQGLKTLSESDRARLAELVEAAKARQSASLDRAIEDGLAHLPRLLRRPARLLIFG